MRVNLTVAVAAIVTMTSSASAQLFAAIAPEGRSAQIGEDVTFFISGLNNTAGTLTNCSARAESAEIESLSYQTVDAANVLTGTPNTPATIAPGGVQGYVVAFSYTDRAIPSSRDFSNQPVVPVVECDEATSENPINLIAEVGVSEDPVPDIVAIGVTPSADGVVRIPDAGSSEVFAAAAINIGPTGRVLVNVRGGGGNVNAAFAQVCETGSDGGCLAPPSASLEVDFETGETRTFSVFAETAPEAGIAFAPDFTRQQLGFTALIPNDPIVGGFSTGPQVGGASAALVAPTPLNAPPNPGGVYNTLITNENSDGRLFFEDTFFFSISPLGDLTGFFFSSEGLIAPIERSAFFLNEPASVEITPQPDGTVFYRAEDIEVSLPFVDELFLADLELSVRPQESFFGTLILPEGAGVPNPTLRGQIVGWFYHTPYEFLDIFGSWEGRIFASGSVISIGDDGTFTLSFIDAGLAGCDTSGTLHNFNPNANLMRLEFTLPTSEQGCVNERAGTTYAGSLVANGDYDPGVRTAPRSVTVVVTGQTADGPDYAAISLRPPE